MLIARYTTNASGVVPTFNDGYEYTVSETESEGVYTVELNSDVDFTSCNFNGITNLLTLEYLKVTSNITTLANMFFKCSNLTSLDVSNWNTSNVTNMSNMFNSCSNLTTLDASNFNTNNVNAMNGMFYKCTNLTSLDVRNWVTSNVNNMSYIFNGCSNLTSLDLSNWDTRKVTTMSEMFKSCANLTSLDVSNWDTSNVSNMSNMFNNCNKLTTLDLSNFDTSKVYNMYATFYKCTNLTSLDVSNWITSNVTTMSEMFNGCSNLTSLDLSNWNTSKVSDMTYIFNDCSNLTSLDVSNWDTSNVTKMIKMFNNCNNLSKVRLLNSDINTVNTISGLISADLYVDMDLDITSYNGTNKLFGVRQEIKELPELHHGQELVKIDGKYYIYHTLGKEVLDGSEDWGTDTDGNILVFYYVQPNVPLNANRLICDKFKTTDSTCKNYGEVHYGGNVNNRNGNIVFSYDCKDVTTWKNWLSENPTTVLYELENPYYEEITLEEFMKVYIRPTNVKIKNSSNIKINVKVVN